MIRLLFKCVLLGGILFAAAFSANGQARERSAAEKVLNGTARTTYVVVGTTAKYGWKTSKFAAKHVAKPVFTRAAPAAGKFVVRQTGTALKLSYPVVKKLAITYLKL